MKKSTTQFNLKKSSFESGTFNNNNSNSQMYIFKMDNIYTIPKYRQKTGFVLLIKL